MGIMDVNGLDIAYDVIGSGGQPWIITPGGRFSKDYPGIRTMAEALAAEGQTAIIWDRPNCGESSVCFDGSSESRMQADTEAQLLRQLGLGPAIVVGGSGGARVSLLTAGHHPDVVRGLGVWWMSGGTFGLMSLAMTYGGPSLAAAWREGIETVPGLAEWKEVTTRNPANVDRILKQDRKTFIATMERWMQAYFPRDDELVPGIKDADVRAMNVPTLVFRSGESDAHHTRETSERLAALVPGARLVEPPWGDREWIERGAAAAAGGGSGPTGTTTPGSSLFDRWYLLVPQLVEWARGTGIAN
ncbi:MAG: alpha/beta fold hydrolase [Acidimicrobiia bacterium]